MFGMLFMLIEYYRLHGVQLTLLVTGSGNEKAIAHLHLPPGIFITAVIRAALRHRNARLQGKIRNFHCHLQSYEPTTYSKLTANVKATARKIFYVTP